MYRKIYFITVLLVVTAISLGLGQSVDYSADYKTARAYFDQGDFSKAYGLFTQLHMADPANPLSNYTNYFLAISTYKLGQKEKAKEILLGISQKHADWEKLPEVFLWLSKISFELDSPNQGIYYANRIDDDAALISAATTLKNSYLAGLDNATLQALLDEHNDPLMAEIIAKRIIEMPYRTRNYPLLDSLIWQYNLDSTRLGLVIPDNVIKEKYTVGVLLPLFTERLWQSGVYLQKSFAVEIYEGIRLAMAEFDSSKLAVKVFDTKRSAKVAQALVKSGNLKDVDAIIGPLYPETLEIIEEYCYEHQTNMVNPVSTNSELLRNNPYAFLLRTGAESTGRKLANFCEDKFENRNYAIYSGTKTTDSMAVYTYAQTLAADSFNLMIIQKTAVERARDIFDSLTSAIQVVDTLQLQKMLKAGEKVNFKPMRDSLRLKVDTLGHIFIASDNQAIASEVMSAVIRRGDTTQIIAIGDWFSTANAGLEIIESLDVWLAMQEFEDMMLPINLDLRRRYMDIYHTKPSKYVYYGYHAMRLLGKSLLKYGVYFQNGYNTNGLIDPLYDFHKSQDNRKLLIYHLHDGVPSAYKAAE